MDYNIKYGKLSDLEVKYFIIGPRNAWDTVLIGPFKTHESAKEYLPSWAPEHCIYQTTAHGLRALEVLEQMEEK